MRQIDKVFGLGRLTGTRVRHGFQFCPRSTSLACEVLF
jgi:hypothetical protein